MRRWRWVLALCLALGAGLLALGWHGATRDPVVRRATVALPGWPAGAPPLRLLLLTDLHVAGPDMPPARLARIVAQANALRPDLVLIAGDLVSDKRVATHRYPLNEAVAPLARLRAPLGIVAVLGNHDYWRDAPAARRALRRAGATVLADQAARRGRLVIAGADDAFTGRFRADKLSAAIAARSGPVVVVSHSPDVAPALPARAALVLAGHTHCGQIVLPLVGAPATFSAYGERYRCGLVREVGRTIIIGAGLGTSILPFRIGAPPDLWLVTVGPTR